MKQLKRDYCFSIWLKDITIILITHDYEEEYLHKFDKIITIE